MIKAVKFNYVGGFSNGSRIVIDDEKNIESRINSLCDENYHCEHTEPKDVSLEKINIQELTALDLVNLVRLGVKQQSDEELDKFIGKFQFSDKEGK